MADSLGEIWWEENEQRDSKTKKEKKKKDAGQMNEKNNKKMQKLLQSSKTPEKGKRKAVKRKDGNYNNNKEQVHKKAKLDSSQEQSPKPAPAKKSPMKLKAKPKKKLKKAPKPSAEEDTITEDSPSEGKAKSGGEKKKKKERKRISEVSDEELSRPGTAEDLRSLMTTQLKGRLEEEALQDTLPDPETDFLPTNADSMDPSEYLKTALPTWRAALKKSLFMKKTGSPCLLIVTSSAIRAVELNRQIKNFVTEKGKVAKLFAKHMKLEEQKKFLSKSNCQVGIGTPARIIQLVKQGALQLESLVGVVLDWNWRDQKLKRMADIPEVRAELVALIKDFLIETVQGSECKLGLL